MTEAIVDRLQLVEIDEQDRELPAVAISAHQLVAEPDVKVATVVEAGQIIDPRQGSIADGVERVLNGRRHVCGKDSQQLLVARRV